MTKSVVTASMLYIGILMFLSRGWLGTIRRTIARLSGVDSGNNTPPPSGAGSGQGGGGGGVW